MMDLPNAGRPITLRGGLTWAWMTRTEVLALQTYLDTAGRTATLTLHDARTFTVGPRRTDGPAVEAKPRPRVGTRPAADPTGTTGYYLEALRLVVTA
jgi:hypothetical protein